MLEGTRTDPPFWYNRLSLVALVRFTAKSPGYPVTLLLGVAAEKAESAGISLIARATSRR